MKKIKIVQDGWTNFTGWYGPVYFENNISVEPTTPQIMRRLSALIQIEEVEDDGTSHACGIAHDMVEGKGLAYAETGLAIAVSEEDIAAEKARDRLKIAKPTDDQFKDYKQLEAIADEKGINGLREIGKIWNVKHRSIPNLIKLILEAQADYRATITGKPVEPVPEPEEITEEGIDPAEDGIDGFGFVEEDEEIKAAEATILPTPAAEPTEAPKE